MIKTQIIKIDSSKGDRYYNEYGTSFEYKFDPIDCDNDQCIKYNLISASIPYSFYGVNDYNDNLDITEISNNITTHRSIQLPHGNYNADQYARELLSELNGVNSIVYHIDYMKISNRFNIRIVNGSCIMKFKTGNQKNNHNSI